MHKPSDTSDVVVIGAGLSGLAVAERLVRAGQIVKLVDKSRGVGGRVATRRFGDTPFDYGTLVLPHELGPTPREGARHAVRAAFGDVVSRVETESKATSLHVGEGDVTTVLEGGRTLVSRHVVVALPAPQALGLVHGLERDEELARVDYEVCVVVVLALERPDGARATWRTDFPCATPEEREKPDDHWLHLAKARRAPHDVEDVEDARVTDAHVHRWCYARPTNRLAGTHRALADGRVWLVGDYFDAGTEPVDAALASGRAGADALLHSLRQGEPWNE